jgi:D-alanine-D-alanine ligase
MSRRVLVLTHQDFQPPDSFEGLNKQDIAPWKTEIHVLQALEKLGHETMTLGKVSEIGEIRRHLYEWKSDIVFNLLEEFRGEGFYVPYVLGFLELMRQPFTGCNPGSLLLADNKTLMKKILRYHRIPVPDFVLFVRGRAVKRARGLAYPLIVKSSTEHGSVGIAQASIVTADEKLKERVEFIHEQLKTDAIAEEYIEGRELYVGVIGNRRLQTFPVWEMVFENLPDGAPHIATAKVKWDRNYQKKSGIKTRAAEGLADGVRERVRRMCKRVFRILGLNGYARMDIRLTNEGKIYLLEPNPNPDIARDEDFADSAKAAGVTYEQLIRRILNLGLRYHAE